MSTTLIVSNTTGGYWYPGYYLDFTPTYVPTYIPIPTTYIQLSPPPYDKIGDLIKAIDRLAEAMEKQNGMAKRR